MDTLERIRNELDLGEIPTGTRASVLGAMARLAQVLAELEADGPPPRTPGGGPGEPLAMVDPRRHYDSRRHLGQAVEALIGQGPRVQQILSALVWHLGRVEGDCPLAAVLGGDVAAQLEAARQGGRAEPDEEPAVAEGDADPDDDSIW